MPSFHDILRRARLQVIADETPDLQITFYRLYLLALSRELEKVRPADVQTEADSLAFLRRVVLQMARYGQASEIATKNAVLRILQRGIDAHKEALRELTSGQISASFTGVNRDAFENLFLRRSMGLTSSYRSLSVAEIRQSGRVIEGAVERMVLDGESWQRATQRIIESLTQGDPEVGRVAKAMGRNVKGLGRWLEDATNEHDEDVAREARKVAYNARRIARTEVAHAYHEADRMASARSPVVKALQWNLSYQHPEPDECDIYAKHDFHGMGPGVYPPEYLPPLPHPHCLCYNTHVLWGPGEWRKPHPPPQGPAALSAGDVSIYMPAVSAKRAGRALGLINGTSRKLIELQDV